MSATTKIIFAFIITLMLGSIIIIACAPAVQPDTVSKGTVTLVVRQGSVEIWKFTDTAGVVVNTCYIAVNTYSTSGANPSIACP